MDQPHDFDPDFTPHLPSAPSDGFGRCGCIRCRPASVQRRLFTRLLGLGAAASGLPAWARDEGVDVGRQSRFTQFVSAEKVEAAAAQNYLQLQREAAQQGALLPPDHPQVQRLRAIAKRIIPQALPWNPRAKQWRWEVNVINSSQLNAFCMPGGKIAFYYGILVKLKLTDDEVATIMGHEVAHALREHARERMGKGIVTNGFVELGSALFGLGNTGRYLANLGGQLAQLTFSREDETEADLVGMELAARAGFDPAAGVSLWQKMGQASKGTPPQWLSTHPAGPTRIRDIEANLPKVEGLYARAEKPAKRFDVAQALRDPESTEGR